MIFLMIRPFAVVAQDEDCVGAVMRFMGVTDLEELDSYEVERLSEYYYNPIELNLSSVSDLQKSGLFTYYQIVSLTDYRTRHGDLISFTELASVDGFTQVLVAALSPFVSLESWKILRESGQDPVSQDLSIRSVLNV